MCKPLDSLVRWAVISLENHIRSAWPRRNITVVICGWAITKKGNSNKEGYKLNNDRINILAKMPVGKALLKLSTPSTIAMSVHSLYNIVDTMFVGRYVGALGIAGLSIAFPIQIIATGMAGMYGMGGASVLSRQLGRQDQEGANTTLVSTFIFCVITGIIYGVVGLTFINPILRAFGASDNIYPYAQEYMRIIFPGIIFFMTSIVLNNVVRAEGAAKISMIANFIGAGGNIVLDFFFIVIFRMGITGGALATVIAQGLATVFLLSHYLRMKSIFTFELKYLKLKFELFQEIVSIGFSAFFTQAGNSILSLVLNNTLGFYGGDIMISVYGVVNKVNSFLILPMIGIRQGSQPLLGYSYGAQNFERLNETIKTGLRAMFTYVIIAFTVLQILAPRVFYLFASDMELVNAGAVPLRIVTIFIFLMPITIYTSALFQSIGYARQAILTSVIKVFVVIPVVYLLSNIFGTVGIFASLAVADFITAMICLTMLIRIVKQFHRTIQAQEIESC